MNSQRLEVGRALSCDTRISLLLALADRPATVTELVAHTGSTQPNVSNHLAVLKSAGLVTGRREGRTAVYELTSPDVAILINALVSVADRSA